MHNTLDNFEELLDKKIKEYKNIVLVLDCYKNNNIKEANKLAVSLGLKHSSIQNKLCVYDDYVRSITYLESLTKEKMQGIIDVYENPNISIDEIFGCYFFILKMFIQSFIDKKKIYRRSENIKILKKEQQKNMKKIEQTMRFEDDDVPKSRYSFYG